MSNQSRHRRKSSTSCSTNSLFDDMESETHQSAPASNHVESSNDTIAHNQPGASASDYNQNQAISSVTADGQQSQHEANTNLSRPQNALMLGHHHSGYHPNSEVESKPTHGLLGVRGDALQKHSRPSSDEIAQNLRKLRNQGLLQQADKGTVLSEQSSASTSRSGTLLPPHPEVDLPPGHVGYGEAVTLGRQHAGSNQYVANNLQNRTMPTTGVGNSLATTATATAAVPQPRRITQSGVDPTSASGIPEDKLRVVAFDIKMRLNKLFRNEIRLDPEYLKTMPLRFEARLGKWHYLPNLDQTPIEPLNEQFKPLRLAAYQADVKLQQAIARQLRLLRYPFNNLVEATRAVRRHVYHILINEMKVGYPDFPFAESKRDDPVENYAYTLAGCLWQQNKHTRQIPGWDQSDRINCIMCATVWIPELIDNHIARLSQLSDLVLKDSTAATSATAKRKLADNLQTVPGKRAVRSQATRTQLGADPDQAPLTDVIDPRVFGHAKDVSTMQSRATIEKSPTSQHTFNDVVQGPIQTGTRNNRTLPRMPRMPRMPVSCFLNNPASILQTTPYSERPASEQRHGWSNLARFTANDLLQLQAVSTVFHPAPEMVDVNMDDSTVAHT